MQQNWGKCKIKWHGDHYSLVACLCEDYQGLNAEVTWRNLLCGRPKVSVNDCNDLFWP